MMCALCVAPRMEVGNVWKAESHTYRMVAVDGTDVSAQPSQLCGSTEQSHPNMSCRASALAAVF